MFLLFLSQVCFVVVSSNPLCDLNICPIATYPSYGHAEQLLVQTSNNNPYLQNLFVQNQLTSNIPTNTILPHQPTNLLVPNYQFFHQNGLATPKQTFEPFESQKVINNYILIPEEYLTNDGNIENKVSRKVDNNLKSKIKKKSKKQRQNISSNTHREKENGNNREIILGTKPEKVGKNEVKKSKSKKRKSKKGRQRNKVEAINSVVLIEEKKYENENGDNVIPLPNKFNPETSKALPSDFKTTNKDATGFADVHVCFDINEDCTDLDCRHTRSKDVNTRNNINKPHTKPPQDLSNSNNFMNYMNSFSSNQQISPNFFSPNVNFPFNFDYLYQTPQTSNAKPKDSGNRRRNRKRKQPTNRQTNSNRKVKNFKTTTGSCDKVVELVPETTEADITTVASVTTTVIEEIKTTPVIENMGQEIILDTSKSNIEKPPKRTDGEAVNIEVSMSEENIMPFDNYNDIMDEYYPDFTSDKSYMSSKEDYEFNNFHERYYYACADNIELNRDRIKSEHQKDNQLHEDRKYIPEVAQNTETSIEKVQVFSKPVLEFPGFKTEKINKEQYFAKNENYGADVNFLSRNKMSSYSDLKENIKPNDHNTNNVEMVFANSKVVKYGIPEKEVTTKPHQPEYKKETKKNVSDDNKTIVIIAKSLDYT